MPKSFRWTAWILITATLATMVGAAAPRNLPKAIQTQLELQRQRPQDPKVANDLGNLLVLARREAEAEIAYERAIELSAGGTAPLYNLGLLQQRQGRVKEALGNLKKVVERDPGNAWAHYQVGALYESLGDKPRAVAAYAQAFAQNPELASSRTNPQVIESKWVTEALLEGYREAIQQSLAPQAYGERDRIALLMISSEGDESAGRMDESPEAMEEGEPASGGATLSEAGDSASGSPVTPVGPDGEDEGVSQERGSSSQSARKVLTPDTIERGGTLGQVGGTSRSSRSRSSRARAPRTRARQTTRSNRRQDGSSLTASRRGSVGTAEGTPLNPKRRSTGRVRYRPSTQSTGRLDLELIPAPDQVVPAG